ncbi:MarR family winged helix-turn-helix transcriptional regulator [Actinorhabdospora filicis]|uniref:MarR family winged helix-turn-helix transcriptional regulator n=1 Tax=Actinorhabdospora filicis TaxID=1785913 RepID=UPI0025567282|nr:MarR family winged helix-turn-helix transcriptional regulator [Actinorhabdospora filicis]
MNDVAAGALSATAAFQLGTVGAITTDRYTRAIAPLKPKQAGILLVLSLFEGMSQQDLARKMGVAPSLLVGLLDELQDMGAVRRERDEHDRRRQIVVLTEAGRELYGTCAAAAKAMDEELLKDVADPEAFRAGLRQIAAGMGLPV